MRFFDFPDDSEKIPARLQMQLLDLAQVLTRNAKLQLDFGLFALYDESRGRITVSTFWEGLGNEERLLGMKSDVYLRAIGNAWFSDSNTTRQYLALPRAFPSFSKQLFALCEDVRLEGVCRRLRPGTSKALDARHRLFGHYVAEQRSFHEHASHLADVLLLSLYQRFTQTSVTFTANLEFAVASVESLINRTLTAKQSADIARECEAFLREVSPFLQKDAVAMHFTTSEYNGVRDGFDRTDTFADMVRTNQLSNETSDVVSISEDVNQVEEQMDIWHRETKQEASTLLQMNVEHGVTSDRLGDTWREGADEDVAFSEVVQGRSQSSVDRQDVDSSTPGSRVEEANDADGKKTGRQTHSRVRHRFLPSRTPTDMDFLEYDAMSARVAPFHAYLKRIVEAHLELKLTERRQGLLAGRLSNQLVKTIIQPTPRMFYKKESPIHEFDAVFALLVDCSGSMFDRMEETRLGVTLFHETLKSLRVVHTVTGFWEDTDSVEREASLTLFQTVIEYDESLKLTAGPAICQLEPQLDNRDGYAIRTISKHLSLRPERRKFLIVFSDGEPAAMDYETLGVYDTHQAVLEARRRGIQVVNVFFSGPSLSSHAEQTIHDIYGAGAITVPTVEDIPNALAKVLRKLLASMMM